MNRITTLVKARSDVIMQKVKMPERFKGTMVENWVRYWKNLLRDYKDVVTDTVTSVKTQPVKAATYVTLLATGAVAIRKNPSERNFRSRVIESRDEVCVVAETVRNPAALNYVNNLETLFNEGRIRHVSLVFFSLFWIADINDDLALPRANCEFLQPAWLTWHTRVIDVGFWGRFWNLEKNLQDFDVNPAEWEHEEQTQ